MRVNAEFDLKTGTTVAELISALDGVPRDAVVSIRRVTGDRFGPDTNYIKLTWEVGNGKTTYNVHDHGSASWNQPGVR